MKKRCSLLLALLFVACASAPAPAPAPPPATPPTPAALVDRAMTLLNDLAGGRFADATHDFTPLMKEKLPATALADFWSKLLQQAGPFRQFGGPALTREDGYDVVVVPAQFANVPLNARVVFDQHGSVAGLFFVPR